MNAHLFAIPHSRKTHIILDLAVTCQPWHAHRPWKLQAVLAPAAPRVLYNGLL
jgi:hypothetical protein